MINNAKTNRKNNRSVKINAVITSHKIISIRFTRNWLQFINNKSKYMIKYKTDDDKIHIFYYPKKRFIKEILFKCMYIPNYAPKALNHAFKDITRALKSGDKELFFDKYTEHGRTTYIRVSDIPFKSPYMLDIARSQRKEWLPMKKDKRGKITFLEMLKKSN